MEKLKNKIDHMEESLKGMFCDFSIYIDHTVDWG